MRKRLSDALLELAKKQSSAGRAHLARELSLMSTAARELEDNQDVGQKLSATARELEPNRKAVQAVERALPPPVLRFKHLPGGKRD